MASFLQWSAPLLAIMLGAPALAQPAAKPIVISALKLAQDDVIPTANDWLALPDIRAKDAALTTLNVTSMRYRGLIEFAGLKGQPLMTPFIMVDGVRKPFANLSWTLKSYWIPTATMQSDGLRASITYVTPPDSHAAIIRFQVTNISDKPINVAPGMEVGWGATHRVTYSPELLSGKRTQSPTPIDDNMEVFNYSTDDTQFAWGFGYVGSKGDLHTGDDPGVTARHEAVIAPGQTLDVHYLIGVGLEEYSAAYAMRVLNKRIDRYGTDGVIDQAAAAFATHTRHVADPQLDLLMNRNYLFTTSYAWGRAIDTEQFIGVTSRSNRYYVSAAFWDRDAMIWSFPALLDTDPARARDALAYTLGVQGHNIGIHSRFINGVVLEDGLETDELVAPLLALHDYVAKTGDTSLLAQHREVLQHLVQHLMALQDKKTGLFETFQDSADEYIKKPFSVYDNVLVWKELNNLAADSARTGNAALGRRYGAAAIALKAAIMKYGVASGAPGAGGPIFAKQVDGTGADFGEDPPGSMMKYPTLGFIAQDDPLFQRSYKWLHGGGYPYAHANTPYGLPGNYRLPSSTAWVIADHLRLKAGRALALKILKTSAWDGGIITEGIDPQTGKSFSGNAFATAAGYVAHTICAVYCTDHGGDHQH
ncbi:MAG: glycoside hydrolase family 125 protein [Alphaproteobacteria bacterium]|nr:glycoside hydrolase family 125 protein [Alphaproteobacteria bacterium]